MKQLSSMLSFLFGIIFWGFRLVITYMDAVGKDSGFPIQILQWRLYYYF